MEDARDQAAGWVLDIDRFASHDGPGIRTAVFLKGCPLACRWCHSPESQSSGPELLYQGERCTSCGLCVGECPEEALAFDVSGRAVPDRDRCTSCGRCVEVCYPGALRMAGQRMTVAEVLSEIEKDIAYFRATGGGMTLSGGEPAHQHRFSLALLERCREKGIPTALETSGFASWPVLRPLAEASDLVLYDLKHMDPETHRSLTGVTNEPILENLRRLAAEHPGVHVRVPCITDLNDGDAHVEQIARFVAGLGLREMTLLPYNGTAGAKYRWIAKPYTLDGTGTQSPETMERLAQAARAAGLLVHVGG